MVVFNKVKDRINYLESYFNEFENLQKNEQLFNPFFLKAFNKTLNELDIDRSAIFSNLKIMIKNIYFIIKREQSFDLMLKEDYSDLIKFLAALELEQNMQDLFDDFVGQKNLLFFNVKEIKENIRILTVSMLNIYDTIENLLEKAKLPHDDRVILTMDDLRRFFYILGVIREFRDFKHTFLDIEDQFLKNLREWDATIVNFDESLEELKLYYHQRYVEGISDDNIEAKAEEIFEEEGDKETPIELEKDGDEELTEEEAERDPINICNMMLLSNYDIKGEIEAFEVDKYDRLEACPNIENSCCQPSILSTKVKNFNNKMMPGLILKYEAIAKVLYFLLANYEAILTYGYKIMRLEEKHKDCEVSAKNILFTPINRDFIDKFQIFTAKAHEFALQSRSGLYCSVCDFDFHKSMMEDSQIKISRDFCHKMVEDTFDFTSVYNLQLIDYFNNLAVLMQCDEYTGERRQETDLSFIPNESIVNLLVECDDKNKEDCFNYCKEFFFTNFESIYEVDFEKILKFFRFMLDKMNVHRIKPKINLNYQTVQVGNLEVKIESSTNMNSIDNMEREIIEDAEDLTAHNPFKEGADLHTIKRLLGFIE